MSIDLSSLHIELKGSSGIEIRVKMPEKFFCGEYTIRNDLPVAAFISPFRQFEPTAMEDFRAQVAHEIVRKAVGYDDLLKKSADLERTNRELQRLLDRRMETQNTTFRMWKEDRVKAGLAEDFSDIKSWPPEMMSGYDNLRDDS